MTKTMTVEVKFTRKNNKYTAKLKALHNGVHTVEKQRYESENIREVFDLTSAFITKHEATNIALTRGLVEDSFAKYLTELQSGDIQEEKEIEGILIDSVDEANQELLADLRAYKLCVHDAIRHQDYEGMLLQGVLYNVARAELHAETGQLANAYEMVVDVPLTDREKMLSASLELRKGELANGLEPFKVEKHNRVVIFTKTDYKLTVNFI